MLLSMKKYLLFLGIIFQTNASAQTYSFSMSNETYNDLLNPTQVSGTALWATTTSFRNIPLGFTFQFFNQSVSKINAYGNGYADLQNFNYAVNFFLCNLKSKGTVGNSLSPVSYRSEGSSGARIFKLEFKNAGLANSDQDFINVQLWLYEGSGRLEVRFGPMSVTHNSSFVQPYNGPLVSLENWSTNELYYLKGDPASPMMTNAENCLNAVPVNGTVYRFRNNALEPVGQAEFNPPAVSVFPNPASTGIKLIMDELPQELSIMDITGQQLYYSASGVKELDISQLSSGLYLLSVQTKRGRAYTRIAKQ